MKKAGWSSILVAAMLLAVAVLAEAQQPSESPSDRLSVTSSAIANTPGPQVEAIPARAARSRVY